MNYRREIDGLRALAILPVIFFHADFQSISGGFVGVDVFFVISGYLITSVITSEIKSNSFSLVKFYERRARRILPALFFVMATCIPVAWFLLSPEQMKDFATSVASVVLFISNFYFRNQVDYFDTAADLQPMLHTWSLAVEEQYYLIFPLILIAIKNFSRLYKILLFSIILLASLFLAEYLSSTDPKTAFFLLPTRGWELLIGASLAFYFSVDKRWSPTKTIAEIGGAVGLVMIVYSVFAFDLKTPSPSFFILIPTIGAALVILFATPNTYAGDLLGKKIFVSIGLISYSAYLWHQPLLAFARISGIASINEYFLGMTAILSIVLAYFSWRYVENPIRSSIRLTTKTIFMISGLGIIAFVGFGFTAKQHKGFISRYPENQRGLLEYEDSSYRRDLYKNIYRMGTCFLDAQQNFNNFSNVCQAKDSVDSVLIWGDSHAAALSYGLRNIYENVSQYNVSGCPPFVNSENPFKSYCRDFGDYLINDLSSLSPAKIFVHANWLSYAKDDLVVEVHKTIKKLKLKFPSSKIYIIGPVPQWQPSLPSFMLRKHVYLDREYMIENSSLKELKPLDQLLNAEVIKDEVNYLSPINILCEIDKCLATVIHNNKIAPTTFDYGHLTAEGSIVLANKLLAR